MGRAVSGPQRPLCVLALAGLAGAAGAAALAALSGPLYRLDWLSLGGAFVLLRWAAYGAAAASLVCIAGLVRARPGSRRRGAWAAAAGLVIAGITAWIPLSHQNRAESVPAIHDITTDIVDPPEFRAVLPLRPEGANSLVYDGEDLARRQQQAYPDIGPALFEAHPIDVFNGALASAREMNWRIVEVARDAGRIEAVATTFWFGFRDDVIVRIRSAERGTRVDVRSVSRLGISDTGTNAARIRRYLDALKSRL